MSAGLRTPPRVTRTGAGRGATPTLSRWDRFTLHLRTRRSRGRPRRTLLTWLTLVALLAGGVIFLFFFSAAFVVKDLQVDGGREEVQASAVALAQIPEGRPLARVAEGAVSERVLTDRRIAEVTVERDWPSTVRLVLTERDPVLALTGGGATWLADAGGNVYEQVEQPSNKLPSFETRGEPTELDQRTVAGVAQLWRMRPDPDVLKGDLSRPRIDDVGTVTLRVGEVRLLWGPPEENEKKWQVVRAIISQDAVDPQGETRVTIDVRTPDTPVVTGLPAATG